MTKDIVLVGVTVAYMDNALRPFSRRVITHTVTHGTAYDYLDTDLTGKAVYLNGFAVSDLGAVIPQPGDVLAVTPYVAGWLGNILGFVASIALGGLVGGLVRGLAWGGIAGAIGKSLVYGALMYLGGKVINSVFKLNQPAKHYTMDSSYGWDLPRLCSTEGAPIGETYGECIPQPQLLMSHVDTVHEGDKDAQYLNLLLCGGWGAVDSIDKIRIGYTPIEHFKDVQMETRLGQNDQKPISFFPNTVQDTRVDLEMDMGTPIVRSTESEKAERLDITVEAPQGLYHMLDNGSLSGCSVSFYAEYQKLNGDNANSSDWKQAGAWSISGSGTGAVRQTYTVADKLPPGRYAVRLTTTARSHDTRDSTYVTWSVLTSYQYDGAKTHPGKVLVGLRIKATGQLSGSLPDVNWRQRRMLVWVYDCTDKRYVQKSARNPIWAAYDILHQCKRLKDPRTGKLVFVVEGCSKDSFSQYWDQWVAAAAYAAEQVPNGVGGSEQRFAFDAFFSGSVTRWDAASKAAAVGHAAILRYGTQYGITVDRPGVICQVFGEGQIIQDSFSGSFASADERARAVEITYNDTQNDFKNTLLKLYSPTYAADTAKTDNTAKVSLFGVSGRGQAYREGMYYLATNERQRQSVSFGVDVAGLACQYGDIIGVSHTAARPGGVSGRIREVANGKIVIDKEVKAEPGVAYTLTVTRGIDGGLTTRTVTVIGDTLTPGTPYTERDMPHAGDPYVLSVATYGIKPYRITKITQNGDHAVTITAIEYDEAIYQTDWSRFPKIAYQPKVGTIATPTGISAVDDMTGAAMRSVKVTWSMPTQVIPTDRYFVYYRPAQDSAWTYYAATPTMYAVITGLAPRTQYYIRVCAAADGLISGYAQCSVVTSGKKETEGSGVKPQGVKLAVLSRKGTHGSTVSDLHVHWTPDTCAGLVYYRTGNGEWLCAGAGLGQMVIPGVSVGLTYEVAVVGDGGKPDKPDATITVSGVTAPPTAPTNVAINLALEGEKAMLSASWDASIGDIDFYEIRFNGDAGDTHKGYCGRTADVQYRCAIPDEAFSKEDGSITVYVYARDVWGQYSTEAVCKKTVPVPKAPLLTVKPEINALYVRCVPQSDDWGSLKRCVVISIDDAMIRLSPEAASAGVHLPKDPGVYRVYAFWIGLSQASPNSPEEMVTVKKTIDPALIAAESITMDKIDGAVTDAIQGGVLSRVDGKIDAKAEVLQKNVLSRVDGKIDGKLGSLRTDLSWIINAIRGNVQDLRRRADTLSGQVTGLKESVDGISSVVNDRVQKSVSGFVQRADRLEGMVKDATNSLSALSQRADTIESTVQDATNSLSALSQRADTIESTVQTAKQDRDRLREQLSSIQQTSAGIVSRVESVEYDNKKQYKILRDIDDREERHKNTLESRITQQADRITSVVGNLSSVESAREAGYTAITQLQDAIGLKVSKGDIKSEVALGLQGVTLSGKQVHITGDTVIDKDVITKGMIQAGAITGDKLDVKDLSSITANIGSVQGGTITGATIRNSDGSFSVSPNGDIKGARIDAASVFASGRALRPVIVSEQRLHSGDTIAYPQGADPAKCLVIVKYFEPLVFVSDKGPKNYIDKKTPWGVFTHKPYTEGVIINEQSGHCVQNLHVLKDDWRQEDRDMADSATGYDWPASVDPEQAQNLTGTYFNTSVDGDKRLHFYNTRTAHVPKPAQMGSTVIYAAGSECCMDLGVALAKIAYLRTSNDEFDFGLSYDSNGYSWRYSNGAVFDQSIAKDKVYNYFGWRLSWGEYWGMRITSGYVDIVVLSFW